MSGRRLPADAEVAVIGGGITGLTAALELVRNGVRALCLDWGHNAGSTANAGSLHVQMQSRLIRLFPEMAERVERELPLYVRAVAHWQRLAEELGGDVGLKVTGGLMVAEDEAQLEFLGQKSARERARGLDTEIWERPRLEAEAPSLGPAVIGAAFCALEGKVDPLRANRLIERHLAEAGGLLMRGARVTALSRADGGWRIGTGAGEVRAGRIVIAAGAGTTALAAMLGVRILVVAEPLHMNITEAAPPLIHHLVQHAERPITMKQLGAGQVVIGGGWPARLASYEDHPEVELASLVGNLALARHIVPAVAPLRLLRTWAGVNPVADGSPILGGVEGLEGVTFAVPGDAGYTLGPLVGALAADHALGRRPAVPLDAFRPDRFGALVGS